MDATRLRCSSIDEKQRKRGGTCWSGSKTEQSQLLVAIYDCICVSIAANFSRRKNFRLLLTYSSAEDVRMLRRREECENGVLRQGGEDGVEALWS